MPDLNYFCIENIYNGDNSFCFASNNANAATNLEYSLDDGNTWISYQMPTQNRTDGAWINIPINGKCYFRGNNTTFNASDTAYNYLKVANICNISGNIMSLLDKACESTIIGSTYCFCYLFKSLKVVDASRLLLPAMTLANSCYYSMFNGCASLEAVPELPAMTLANSCYSYMFYGCASLEAVPELPATALAGSCYYMMFSSCTSLKLPPELPAIVLANSCYAGMFQNCTSLEITPKLPAMTLADRCYFAMFFSCTALKAVSELSAMTLANNCCDSMFRYCASLEAAPELLAMTLADSCYSKMFQNCTSLKVVHKLPATVLDNSCYAEMFVGCTSLEAAPELPATTLADSCYNSMFSSCRALVFPPELPATTLAYSCYIYMFRGCTSLKVAPKLPATVLANRCYYSMFQECTSLVYPPELKATTLVYDCYAHMFHGCTSLVYLPALTANFLNTNCYYYMFSGTLIKFSKTPTEVCKYRFRLPIVGYLHQDSPGCSNNIFGSDSKNGIEIDTDYYINLPVGPAYINYQINNLLYTTTATIITQDTQEVVVTLSPIEGFSLPETISVIGADATYNQQTGQITITNLVGDNISVIADGVDNKLPAPTISIVDDKVYIPLDYKVDDYEIRFEEVV